VVSLLKMGKQGRAALLLILCMVCYVSFNNAEDVSEKDVLVLNISNISETIKAHPFVVIEFYAPWYVLHAPPNVCVYLIAKN
jgi:hypothetical protein